MRAFAKKAEGIEIAPSMRPAAGIGCSCTTPMATGWRWSGQTLTDRVPFPGREPLNSRLDRRHLRQTRRLAAGPAHVVRLGQKESAKASAAMTLRQHRSPGG